MMFIFKWGAMIMAGVLVVSAIASIVYECLPSNGDTIGVEIFMVNPRFTLINSIKEEKFRLWSVQ